VPGKGLADATSEAYQLVGILKANLLTIYLDREKDNGCESV
jgi:hypothetical protein